MEKSNMSFLKVMVGFFRGSGKGKEIAIIRTFAALVFTLFIPTYLLILIFPEQMIASYLPAESIFRSPTFVTASLILALGCYQLGIWIAEKKGGTHKKAALIRLVSLLSFYIVVYLTCGGISGVGVNWKHNFIIGIMWATNIRLAGALSVFVVGIDIYMHFFGHVGTISGLLMNVLTTLITFFCSALFKNTVESVLRLAEKARDDALIAKQEAENHLSNINSILNSDMEIAIGIIDENRNIPYSSSYFKRTFGTTLAVEFIKKFDLGEAKRSEMFECLASSLGEDVLNYEVNEKLLPLTSAINGISHKNEWKPIVNGDVVSKVIYIGSNIHTILKLQEESKQNTEIFALQDRCIEIGPKKMGAFLRQNELLLSIAKSKMALNFEQDQAVFREIFRNLHTVKGNSKSFGFGRLADSVHRAEDCLQQHSDKLKMVLDSALAEFSKIKKVCERLRYHLDYVQLSQEEIESSLKLGDDHLRKLVISSSYIRLEDFLKEYDKDIRKLALDLNKCEASVLVNVPSFYLNKNTESVLNQCFTHIIRNAVDHGFETTEERIKNGKPEKGTLFIQAKEKGDFIEMTVVDDGIGLNLDSVKKKAVAKGLMSSDDKDIHRIANMIFESGFSTKESVTDISGRGVGMDAIKAAMKSIGGDCYAEVFSGLQPAKWQLVLLIPSDYIFN